MKQKPDSRIDGYIERIAGGDRRALRSLYNETSAPLLGLAVRLMADRAEAENVLQDAFVTVWQGAQAFDARRETGWIWLITILRHTAYKRLRSRGREASFADPETSPETRNEETAAIDALVSRMDDDRLKHCLEALESEERRSILLAYLDGLSQSQIADRLMAPLASIRDWVRHGLESLRKCLS